MKNGLYILAVLLLCCACFNASMDWPELPENGEACGTGQLLLTLTSDGRGTRAGEANEPPADVDTFLISVYRGTDRVMDTVRLRDLGPKLTLDAGAGYVLQAEDCTSADAEAANGGWGQRHFRGRSEPFVIVADATTSVKVHCSVVNAGLSVAFSADFLDLYSQCVVKIEGSDRNIAWLADEAEEEIQPRVAYFNTDDANETRQVTLLIYKEGENKAESLVKYPCTLEAKKSLTITLKPKGGNEEAEGGLNISATYDPDFVPGTNDEVVIEED